MELDATSCPEYRSKTVRLGRKKYSIPMDSDGFVPTWAILSRYHEVFGNDVRRRDNSFDDERILPPRLTPEEIVEWWADPSTCDIAGIDTVDSEVYDVSSFTGPMREIQSRIAVITPTRKEMLRIRKAIAESFSLEELDEMTSGNSIVIQTVPDGGEAYGVYVRKQSGVATPILIYEEGASPDSIIHELVHHIRTMPSRKGKGLAETTFPMKPDGSVDLWEIAKKGPEGRNRMECVEEATTVAETMMRTEPDGKPSGYYCDVPSGKSIKSMYSEDVKRLKGNDAKRRMNGPEVVNRLNRDFDRLNIGYAEIMGRDSAKVAAKKMYKQKK